ncbi:hypothetical protein HKD37_19G053749 [Glycine soja]
MIVMHARSFGNDHDGNFEDIWRIQIIPEVSIFLWRLFRNRLPSSDNLLRRNILLEGDQGRCLGCNKVVESISHVLFWCPKTLRNESNDFIFRGKHCHEDEFVQQIIFLSWS